VEHPSLWNGLTDGHLRKDHKRNGTRKCFCYGLTYLNLAHQGKTCGNTPQREAIHHENILATFHIGLLIKGHTKSICLNNNSPISKDHKPPLILLPPNFPKKHPTYFGIKVPSAGTLSELPMSGFVFAAIFGWTNCVWSTIPT
jgi:hypothetical protein